MTKSDYYSILEDFGILHSVTDYAKVVNDLIEKYPLFRHKTLQECLDYFERRMSEQENKIKETLNVE